LPKTVTPCPFYRRVRGITSATTVFRGAFCVECTVALSEISVDSVRPLYGPTAGGTRVTITGQHVSTSTVTAVYIGQFKLYPDTNRSQCPSVTV